MRVLEMGRGHIHAYGTYFVGRIMNQSMSYFLHLCNCSVPNTVRHGNSMTESAQQGRFSENTFNIHMVITVLQIIDKENPYRYFVNVDSNNDIYLSFLYVFC